MTADGDRIRFDLIVDGQRFRPTLPWRPTEKNMQRARERMMVFRAQLAAGTFSFSENFPEYRLRKRLDLPTRTYTCGEIFDLFLEHCEARMHHQDLAPCTVASYRQILNFTWRPKIGRMPFLGVRYSTLVRIADALPVSKKTYNNVVSAIRLAFEFGYRDHFEQRDPAARLKCYRIRRRERAPIDPFTIAEAETLIAALHHDWGEAQGNYDEFRFFTGLRPCEQIALLVSDFDPSRGTLDVTKSSAHRFLRDTTKTGEARQLELCPRALQVLSRQLELRARMKDAGRIDHEHLFFDRDGRPFVDTKNPYRRWRRTFKKLQIRYRKPYVARHTSVSWNLMVGRNPVRLAELHGHSPTTMLTVYSAWTRGTREEDVADIRRAIYLSEETPSQLGIDRSIPGSK